MSGMKKPLVNNLTLGTIWQISEGTMTEKEMAEFEQELIREFNLKSITRMDDAPFVPFIALFVEGDDFSGIINLDKESLLNLANLPSLQKSWVKKAFSTQLEALKQ
jgi:hypothetical protein